MITGNLKAQHDRRGENIMIAPPHPPPTPHPLHPLPNTSKKHKTSHQKRDNPACVPAKMKLIFLQPSQNTAPATQMHVLKFIGGRRLKCIFFGVKIEKNAFRLHKMQISKVTYGNFSNVCGYIHIYIFPKEKMSCANLPLGDLTVSILETWALNLGLSYGRNSEESISI